VQIRKHSDGARELGSLVVVPPMRGQGAATRLIDALLVGVRTPLHMITSLPYAAHYQRWGLVQIEPQRAPRSVRFNHCMGRLARVISFLKGHPPRRLVILERLGVPATAEPVAGQRTKGFARE
jgi:amino-acid N-acetyltransferase